MPYTFCSEYTIKPSFKGQSNGHVLFCHNAKSYYMTYMYIYICSCGYVSSTAQNISLLLDFPTLATYCITVTDILLLNTAVASKSTFNPVEKKLLWPLFQMQHILQLRYIQFH